jgi:RNA polymerase sigma-54 factor
MKFGLDLRTSLSQTLTPQQIQYLKLLQLPVLQLEQHVTQEIELNPMLEDFDGFDDFDEPNINAPSPENEKFESIKDPYSDDYDLDYSPVSKETHSDSEVYMDDYQNYSQAKSMIDDDAEPFEFHKMLWDGNDDMPKTSGHSQSDEDDFEPFQIKDVSSFSDDMINQLRLLPLTSEEFLLAENIIGNIDTDGYLRRDLQEIVDDTNEMILDHNFEGKNNNPLYSNGHTNGATYGNGQAKLNGYQNGTSNGAAITNGHAKLNGNTNGNSNNGTSNGHSNGILNAQNYSFTNGKFENPAKQFALSSDSKEVLSNIYKQNPELGKSIDQNIIQDILNFVPDKATFIPMREINIENAEEMLRIIQKLDPPGVGARSIQECLLAQCKVVKNPNAAQKLALEILANHYEAFAKKHYHVIVKNLAISEDMLRETIDVIRRLNPRPGGGDYQSENNTVIPDFIIERDEEKNDLIISVNDSRLPALHLSKAYENMKKEAKYKLYNKDTREWIRNKYEDAKFLIQALRQRKNTMLKVMTSISGLQRDFFDYGPAALKPLIYKDVSEDTGLDISTVCRIVNGKYVQTDFGTFELKFFFSESLPTDDGEEVSTRVIKQILKEVIDDEDKSKPHSDDKLSDLLKDKGYNVARRTVAKYREQLKIPVARLRKEL